MILPQQLQNSIKQKTDSTTTAALTAFVPPQLARSTICLLKTAIATVVGTDLQAEANILLDQGSQRSFLTEKHQYASCDSSQVQEH